MKTLTHEEAEKLIHHLTGSFLDHIVSINNTLMSLDTVDGLSSQTRNALKNVLSSILRSSGLMMEPALEVADALFPSEGQMRTLAGIRKLNEETKMLQQENEKPVEAPAQEPAMG